MTIWLVAVLVGVGVAVLSYAWRGVGAGTGIAAAVLPALLRAVALALLLALLLDATAGASRPVRPLAALDASASWLRARDGAAWTDATRRARAAGSDSLLLVGDSARAAEPPSLPGDRASRVRPAVERALAAGRPLLLFTDGEIDDPESLDGLPSGSRITVVDPRASRDAALAELQAPRAMVAGDTAEVRVSVAAGGAGAGAGSIALSLGSAAVAAAALDSLPPFGERVVVMRAAVPASASGSVLRAVLSSAGDAESRNDSLAAVLEVSPGAGAVLVSTSPDYDARDALGILRGALSLPTRGFYRVAPGVWRTDGSLAPAREDEIRRAVREAPLVVLHGDTSVFGPPRTATRGALVLMVPPVAERSGDWYAIGAPPSPLSAALSGVEWDSLPPLDVGPGLPRADWEGLETRRARRLERRVAIVGTERPRRTVIVAAAGFWRWRFRGGTSADAFSSLWGSVFDWLSAERSDVRAALPADASVRAGDPVRWRRGAGDDSVTTVLVSRRGDSARTDTMLLRFPRGATIVETPARDAGIYDVQARGGNSLLVINPSREWLPRRPSVRSGAVGRAPSLSDAPRLRSLGWVYVVVILALCGEWLLRRRMGYR